MNAAGPHTTQDDDRLGPGVRVDSYLIERRLGAGGMGSVFAARHIGLDKPVALKTLHPTLAAREDQVLRFIREGRAASRIRHPHVVDVTDVGTHDGIPFLVMEYLDGEDLQTRLASCRVFTPAEIARIMLPVIDAVAAAHDKGVVHRDLKPSNVFLERGPHGTEIPKVLDFGIAKILDTDQVDKVTITRAAIFLGTPYYSSPEQAQSGKNADAKSDQYSIGAMMYQLATGRVPVEGSTALEVLGSIVAGEVTPIRAARPGLHPDLAAIVERAMAYRPQDRFPSLRELGAALLPLAEPMVFAQWQPAFGHASVSVPPGPPTSTSRPQLAASPSDLALAATVASTETRPAAAPPARRSRTWIWILAAAGALGVTALAAAGAGWWLSHRDRERGGEEIVAIAEEPMHREETAPAEGAAPPEETAPATVDTVEAPPEETAPVHVVRAEPVDAVILLDGTEIGTGTAEIPDDGQPHELIVRLDGHATRTVRIAPDAPPPALVTLEPVNAARPASSAPARRPPVRTPTAQPLGGGRQPISPWPRSSWGRAPSRPARPPVGNNRAPILD